MKHTIHFRMNLRYLNRKKMQNRLILKRLVHRKRRTCMVKPFMPKLIYVEPRALEYPLGRELIDKFKKMRLEIRETTSHNQIRNLPGDNHFQKYRNAETTLVFGMR